MRISPTPLFPWGFASCSLTRNKGLFLGGTFYLFQVCSSGIQISLESRSGDNGRKTKQETHHPTSDTSVWGSSLSPYIQICLFLSTSQNSQILPYVIFSEFFIVISDCAYSILGRSRSQCCFILTLQGNILESISKYRCKVEEQCT